MALEYRKHIPEKDRERAFKAVRKKFERALEIAVTLDKASKTEAQGLNELVTLFPEIFAEMPLTDSKLLSDTSLSPNKLVDVMLRDFLNKLGGMTQHNRPIFESLRNIRKENLHLAPSISDWVKEEVGGYIARMEREKPPTDESPSFQQNVEPVEPNIQGII